jgi:NADPH-dependent curcumin reductase CurA
MSSTVNRQWCVAARPVGPVKKSDFDFIVAPMPTIGPGQFLVRSKYLSVAPVMRLYMIDGAGIEKPVGIGEVMLGRGVGEIVESNCDNWPVGTIVQGKLGWQDYSVADGAPGSLMYKVTQSVAPISTALGALGMTGFTAYCSLKDIGQVKPGETVVVSGAMGGVGSIAVQVARLMGGRVIGIAGTPEKCQRLTETLGCVAAINYRDEKIREALTTLAPDGVDVFFDNVGGEVLDDVLEHINRYARVISCGHISEYLKNDPYRLRNWAEVGGQRAKLEGFFVYDYEPMFPEAEQAMAQWIADGELHYEEDTLEGLEAMPEALIRLYDGKNVGKQIVHVA